MAISSSLIFLVFSQLMIFHFVVVENKSNCTESFECGNLGFLNFPFTKFTEPDCGLCMLNCETDQHPKIQLGSWYDIIGVKPGNLTRIRAPWRVEKSCNIFYYNISLPNTASIKYSISPIITLFKCQTYPGDPSSDPYFPGYEKFTDCEQYGFCVYFKLPDQKDHSYLDPLPPSCSVIHWPIVLDSDPNFDPKNLYSLLSDEFDVEWHVSVDCYNCRLRGGQCLTDRINEFHCSKGSGKLVVAFCAVVLSTGGVLLLLNIASFLISKCSNKRSKYENVETFLRNYGALAPKRYNYSDIKKMTSSFKTRLGEGGYGFVYKGRHPDGSLVAIKILNDTKGNGEEFINEVASISSTSHVNIVKLLGFCFEYKKRALIYEFMPNGSLEKFIYDKRSLQNRQLGLQTLYNIAVGIARGLEYLHRGCNSQILHFDIKPHNILLDKDFSPKISDFGLSKLCTRTKSIVSLLGARGTIGYIAPEVVCRTFGGVSHKSDVYSYGMMILEMVAGRRNVDAGVEHTSEIYYPHWVYKQLELDQELGFDGILNEEENEKVRKMIVVSLWCIQTDPLTRPSMSKVVEMLEGNLESLLAPPKPYLYSPSRSLVESCSVQITSQERLSP